MSELFQIGRIDPTTENAVGIQRMVVQDLIRMGMTPNEASEFADPDDLAGMVERQCRRLAEHPDRYFGAAGLRAVALEDRSPFKEGDLLGFIKRSRWNRSDQANATQGWRHLVYAALAKFNNEMRYEIDGIFGLAADDRLEPDVQSEVREALVAPVVRRADNRYIELRVTLDRLDPARKLLVDRFRFVGTGLMGRPIGDIDDQQLYFRKPANN